MPIYDLSPGLNALGSGIDSLNNALQRADKQAQLGSIATGFQTGDYDRTAAALARAGDVGTALQVKEFGIKQEQLKQPPLRLDDLGSPDVVGTGPAGTVPPASTPGQTGSISPLAPKAAQQFVSDGTIKNPLGAAAFAAGFQAESKYDPTAYRAKDAPDGSAAVNIGQWNSDRAVDFRNFYLANRSNNIYPNDPNDPATGLAFAKYELQNKPEYAGVKAALENATTPEEAQAAAISYWKPHGWTSKDPTAADDYDRRVGLTKAVYAMMGQQPPGGPVARAPVGAPTPTPGATAFGGQPQAAPSIAPGAPGMPAGFQPTPTNKYIASQIGPAATQKLLTSPGSTPMSEIVDPSALNPITRKMTVDDFYKHAQTVAPSPEAAAAAPTPGPGAAAAPAVGAGTVLAGAVPTPDTSKPPGQGARGPGTPVAPGGAGAPAAGAATAAARSEAAGKLFNTDAPGDSGTYEEAADGSVKVSDAEPTSLSWMAKNAAKYGYAQDPADPTRFVPADGVLPAPPATGAGSTTPNRPVGGAGGQATTAPATPPAPVAPPGVPAAAVGGFMGRVEASGPPGSPQRQRYLMNAQLAAADQAALGRRGSAAIAAQIGKMLDEDREIQKQQITNAQPPAGYMAYRAQEIAANRTPLSINEWQHQTDETSYRAPTPEERAASGYGPLPGSVLPGQLMKNGQPFPPADPTHLRISNRGKIEKIDQAPLIGGDLFPKAETEMEKIAGGGQGQVIKDDILAANSAHRAIQALNVLNEANKAGGDNIQSGPFANQILQIKQGLAEAGITAPDTPGMAPSEVIKKVSFDLATQLVKAITARPAQMEFLKAYENVPGLEMSQVGRQAMISVLAQEKTNDIKLGKLAANRKNWANWEQVKSDFYDDPANAIMSPFRRGPKGEPIPISRVDVDYMAQKAGLKQQDAGAMLPAPLMDVGSTVTTPEGFTVKRIK